MGLGIVERVKKAFQKKEAAKAQPPATNTKQEEVLGSMSFEQATALLAPGGGLDHQRQPAAAKKQPTQQQAVATATTALQWKLADSGAAKKGAPPRPVLGTHKHGGPLPNAAIAKTSPLPNLYQFSPDRPQDVDGPPAPPELVYFNAPESASAKKEQAPPEPMYFNAPKKAEGEYHNSDAPAPTRPPVGPAPARPEPQASRAPAPVLYQNDDDADGQADTDFYVSPGTGSQGSQTQAPPREGAPQQDPGMEVPQELVSDAKQDELAALAVQMPTPSALGASELATLRAAAKHDASELTRMPLTAREGMSEGWALMPMLRSQRDVDTTTFNTNYRYNDVAEIAEHPGGTTQTTDRAETIVELKNGRFVFTQSGDELESRNLHLPGFMLRNAFKDKKAALGRDLTKAEGEQFYQELVAAGGRYIFVMDASGTVYAGENIHGLQHHSSFMGGGAIAAAGELVVSGGRLTLISNQSGHYQPGPGFLWQAIAQMASQGVDMSSVTAEILGVGAMNAGEFLHFFDPVADPDLMRAAYATTVLKRYLANPRNAQAARGRQQIPDAPVTGPEGKQEVAHA
ncbi:MAG: hypothetical protein IT374_02520 [Polyangiaceae bacterium]|nr:hypothetical protein [Polyangiaceae bacterium]